MKWTMQIIACAAMLAIAGCGPSESQPGSEPDTNAPSADGAAFQQPEGSGAAIPLPDGIAPAETRESYLASSGQRLVALETKIDELATKAAAQTGGIASDAQQALDALHVQSERTAEQLERLRTASVAAWDEMKAGFESAFAELQRAYEQTRSQLS